MSGTRPVECFHSSDSEAIVDVEDSNRARVHLLRSREVQETIVMIQITRGLKEHEIVIAEPCMNPDRSCRLPSSTAYGRAAPRRLSASKSGEISPSHAA